MKKCKVCKSSYIPTKPLQAVCGLACAFQWIEIQKARREAKNALAERKQTKERLEKLKSRADYAREAQAAFNAWVRERDKDQPCISCGKRTGCKVNAGHYRSRAAMPALSYHPDNCHLQCEKCNSWLSGNIVEYRIHLLQKIGQERLDWLEKDHPARKYSIDELKEIKREYQKKLQELRRNV